MRFSFKVDIEGSVEAENMDEARRLLSYQFQEPYKREHIKVNATGTIVVEQRPPARISHDFVPGEISIPGVSGPAEPLGPDEEEHSHSQDELPPEEQT